MKSLIFSLMLILNFSLKAEVTVCEEEMQEYNCDQMREMAPTIFNHCCANSPAERVPEDRDSVQIPGMADFEQIQNHISQGNISKEEGQQLMARFNHGQAIIKWSLCRANDTDQDFVDCGPKPELEDFLAPKKRIRKKPRGIVRDCRIKRGSSRAKCGGKNYILEHPDHIGETHDPDASLLIHDGRDPLNELADVLVGDEGSLDGEPVGDEVESR